MNLAARQTNMHVREERDDNTEADIRKNTEKPSVGVYIGLFLLCGSALLFELALTRIFAVIVWSNLAFLIVGTALFGYGLSGVYLALSRARMRASSSLNLTRSALCSSATMVIAYLVITHVPVHIWDMHQEGHTWAALLVWEVCLIAPFFFGGVTVAQILSQYTSQGGRLYGTDLIGAAAGSLALVPLLPLLGGEATIFIAAAMAAVAACCFAGLTHRIHFTGAALCAFALFALAPSVKALIPLQFYQDKQTFRQAREHGQDATTRWSALSRVDVAKYRPSSGPLKHSDVVGIWIDGGTNVSAMIPWDGDPAHLKKETRFTSAAPYALKEQSRPRVLVIGSSGGREVLSALSYGAAHVDAVEMDPSIVMAHGTEPYSGFTGHLFQNSKVHLVNDEGRAFLQRQPEGSYDVIQFVNNYAPAAMAAGALNISETYLLTKEALQEFYRHLSNNGVIALHRGATLRVALTAISALRELGVEHPENHIAIFSGEFYAFQGFFLKKTPFTKDEIDALESFYSRVPGMNGDAVLWSPFDERHNVYSRVLSAPPDQQRAMYTSLGVSLYPATDDRPFLERIVPMGRQALLPELPEEFHRRSAEKWQGLIPRGDLPYVVILAESVVLGLLFLGVPLALTVRRAAPVSGFGRIVTYFGCLGLGFIVVEICLMKRYVLFLGHPATSITTVLVSLLLGAGVGSLLTERFSGKPLRSVLPLVGGLLVSVLILETWVVPPVLAHLMGLAFSARLATAALLLVPVGALMGMPFPLGLRAIHEVSADERSKNALLAWAWGINGYMTVVGSAGTVFIALFFGFRAALVTAIIAYALAMVLLRSAVTSPAET